MLILKILNFFVDFDVDGPNSLWHIDGNHKLIRWRMVIHGGIDSYSKTIVFLRCSDNNWASTLLSVFTGAVQKHGLPERVRTDLGGENVDMWRYMVEQHASMSAVLTGSSTHNERIEMFIGVLVSFTMTASQARRGRLP